MSDTKLYSWFLGPKAENADILERLVLEALRDCVFWRRNFHPEDDILITEKVRRQDEFQDSQALIQQEFLSLLANLKGDIPFYSPRYIGHMLADQLLPAIVAYFAAMLHNPNNVSQEGSPITSQYELDVANQLARLCGYTGQTWGHLTSGGTVANFEALWVARNVKLFPLAIRETAKRLGIPTLLVNLPSGNSANLVEIDDPWVLLNIDPDESLLLRRRLSEAARKHTPMRPAEEIGREVARHLTECSVSGKGLHCFFEELGGSRPGVVLIPATAHYSLPKVIEALGIGRNQVVIVPVDDHFRMDIDSLRERLTHCVEEKVPVYAVVSVLGTTEEGAVDQLHRIVELRDEFRSRGLTFHLHCDGAWGGYVRALLIDAKGEEVETPTDIRRITQSWPDDETYFAYKSVFATDSVTIDPHKLGFIPYPCGTILFRNPHVRELLAIDAPYIFSGDEPLDRPFIGKYILEGSKPGAAAAAVWFAHRIVPLNQDGYGLLIGKSIQSAQELAYGLSHELAPALKRTGIVLRMLTSPPDGNVLCFVVNRLGNTRLDVMNRINQAIYDDLKFHPRSVIQRHNFIISSTSFNFEQYGLPTANGRSSLDQHLEALGIAADEFEKVGTIKILRCTVMMPWLALSRGGNPDYGTAFAAVLQETIERVTRE